MAASAVIEDGRALWVLGGANTDHVQSSTQIVRPGQATQWGPEMTEVTASHCSTTLGDGSVFVIGGQRRSDFTGSARTEVYNITTREWSRRADMGQRRLVHTCSQVYVDPSDHPLYGIIAGPSLPGAVLSVVVAGGEAG